MRVIGRGQLGLALPAAAPSLPVLDQRARGTTFIELAVKQVVNSPEVTKMSFWSLNPYIGCEFGCCYCYARDTHRWTAERNLTAPAGSEPRAEFERQIFVKENAAAVLQRTLEPAKVGNRTIVIGTATDPYQPAERRFGVTRSVLEALLGFRGLKIGITTKSPLVARDVDLLVALAARHQISVSLSIISADPAIIRRFEPKTPLPHARLRAVRVLADAGVEVGLLIAPIIPGITDGWAALGALMAAGKEAGAGRADGFALRLAPVARAGFLPVLESRFPELAGRYRTQFQNRETLRPDYTNALAKRIRTLQKIHGFPVTPERARRWSRRPRSPQAPTPRPEQAALTLVP
jgi:DNA repair photolyase